MTAGMCKPAGGDRFLIVRCLRWVGLALLWFMILALATWATAALYFDLPVPSLRLPAAIAFGISTLAALILIRGQGRKALACLAGFAAVLAWWLSIAPSNDRPWQPDVAETAWAEINGDLVTVHNVRNVDYRTETDYTPHWETRTYDLRDLRAVDLFVTFWGSPWIAHPIVSFQFGEDQHVAFSVETRKVVGQEYSALRGFFRQYELTYIVADERDVIRLRTNHRTGEEVYLYRTTIPPDAAREVFLGYLHSVNALHEAPAFYNALTSNCTTNIRIHTVPAAGRSAAPWDWRLLLNGKGDEYAYQYRKLAGDLPFDELKRRAHINDAARAADQSADFSRLIRKGRPGFGST